MTRLVEFVRRNMRPCESTHSGPAPHGLAAQVTSLYALQREAVSGSEYGTDHHQTLKKLPDM